MSGKNSSWDRYCERHLGQWHGRAVHMSCADARLLAAKTYQFTTTSVTRSRANSNVLVVNASLGVEPRGHGKETSNQATDFSLRYDTESLFVFDDGSYTAESRFLDLPGLLPDATPVPFAIEHALVVSVSERVRVYSIYDSDQQLSSMLLLEEARDGLFENREPLAITSLVGEWTGQAETYCRPRTSRAGKGFGPGPAEETRMEYSKEDLPPELKHASSSKNGLMRIQTQILYGWNPASNLIRRTTKLSDMSGNELGSSIVYGSIAQDGGGMFDLVRFSDGSVMVALPNGCYACAAPKRARGVPATSEVGCLITPRLRRRCARTYAAWGLASETVAQEGLCASPLAP